MATRDVRMLGVDELVKRLEAMNVDVRRKGGRAALRRAAILVREAAKRNAEAIDDPKSREDIRKNLAERWANKFNRRTGDLMFRVGVMGGAGGSKTGEEQSSLPGGDTRHWRYLEFGTEKMRAQPFMRRALEQNLEAAADEFIKYFNIYLDRTIKKGKA